jgi:hypothetical protein
MKLREKIFYFKQVFNIISSVCGKTVEYVLNAELADKNRLQIS